MRVAETLRSLISKGSGLILAMAAYAILAVAPAHATTVITSAVLSGPTTIACCGSATYQLTLSGTYTTLPGATNPDTPMHFLASIYDHDGPLVGDDLLVQLPSFLFPSDVDLNQPANTWVYATSFQLLCPSCTVTGEDGSSHEETAEVYAEAIDFTTSSARARSNTIDVTCVPEPNTWSIMIIGFASIGYTVRRRRGGTSDAKRPVMTSAR